jgi:hypothetical protein
MDEAQIETHTFLQVGNKAPYLASNPLAIPLVVHLSHQSLINTSHLEIVL